MQVTLVKYVMLEHRKCILTIATCIDVQHCAEERLPDELVLQ